MHQLAALRLYFPRSSRANPSRFWHRLSAPALAHHLLTEAKRGGIEQAILHHIDAGYLKGDRLSHHHPETSSMNHPQCIELMDTEQRLRHFLHVHAKELHKVRTVMFRCELPLAETEGPARSTRASASA
jgi:PII-like signaling protein